MYSLTQEPAGTGPASTTLHNLVAIRIYFKSLSKAAKLKTEKTGSQTNHLIFTLSKCIFLNVDICFRTHKACFIVLVYLSCCQQQQ